MSFGCSWCDALFGDWFLIDECSCIGEDGEGAAAILDVEVHLSKPLVLPQPHWCFPPAGQFCDRRADAPHHPTA